MIENYLEGKVIIVGQVFSGPTKNGGEWRKQEIVIETQERYSKKQSFSVFNDNIEVMAFKVGEIVRASIDIESREWNGKWYPSITCYKVSKLGEQPKQSPPQQTQQAQKNAIPVEKTQDGDPKDDLPF